MAASKTTSLVLLFALLTIYSCNLSYARQIIDKQLTDDEAEIRLGFIEDEPGFERSVRPNEDYDYQWKPLHFPQKERNLVKRSSGNRRFQLCGRQLHQMLAVVCNNGRGKRSAKETEGSLDDLYSVIYRPHSDFNIPLAYSNRWYASGSPLDKLLGTSFQDLPNIRTKRNSRSGASRCCRQACSLQQLRGYCPQR